MRHVQRLGMKCYVLVISYVYSYFTELRNQNVHKQLLVLVYLKKKLLLLTAIDLKLSVHLTCFKGGLLWKILLFLLRGEFRHLYENNYLPITGSRSNQCSMTDLTKAVVCTILSVGWWI